MEIATVRQKRSVSLTKQEHKSLKAFRRLFKTDVDCAASIGIDRNVLGRIMMYGSGSPEKVSKIRAKIGYEDNA